MRLEEQRESREREKYRERVSNRGEISSSLSHATSLFRGNLAFVFVFDSCAVSRARAYWLTISASLSIWRDDLAIISAQANVIIMILEWRKTQRRIRSEKINGKSNRKWELLNWNTKKNWRRRIHVGFRARMLGVEWEIERERKKINLQNKIVETSACHAIHSYHVQHCCSFVQHCINCLRCSNSIPLPSFMLFARFVRLFLRWLCEIPSGARHGTAACARISTTNCFLLVAAAAAGFGWTVMAFWVVCCLKFSCKRAFCIRYVFFFLSPGRPIVFHL